MKNVLPPEKKLTAIASALLCLALLFASSTVSFAQTIDSYEVRRELAFALFNEGKQTQAMPLFEKLAAENPKDRDVLETLGLLIKVNSILIKDPDTRKKERIRARGFLLKAKELGAKSALLMAMLEDLPADGSGGDVSFSNQKEAEEAMREAEKAFAGGNMDKAFEGYQKALKADPNLYEAALFSGDTFLHKDEFEKAATWYAKAISINPDRETAYRYWGTALVRQKKMAEARDVYVESFICEPFNRLAVNGLIQWGKMNGVQPGHPRINIPASVSPSKDGNVSVTLGMGEDKNDGSFAWSAYGLARALWQTSKNGLGEKFKKQFPNETTYRHSLAEELEALRMTVTILKERMKDKDSKIKTLEPSLAALVDLHDKGLLEPYILLVLADEGIAKDYYPYFKANRSKMRRYVVEVVLSGATGN